MKSALFTDIARTVSHSRKRFVSILVICALGVTMVTGLRASCVDLRQAADSFYDNQSFYDLSVQSTLGLTDQDVDALAAVSGVEAAVGSWEESTYTRCDGQRASIKAAALGSGMNEPYLLDGRLPEAADEALVTANYLTDTGAQIGDTLTLEKGDNEVFDRGPYTIVGTAIDPAELTNPDGSIAIRASASDDYTLFVPADAVTTDDIFTVAYLQVAGARELSCYAPEYTALTGEVRERVEAIQKEREQARSDQVRADAQAEVDKANRKAQDGFAEAERALADAQATIDSGRAELASSAAQIRQGRSQLAAGRTELDKQAAQIAEGREQIAAGKDEINAGREQVAAGRAELATQCDAAVQQAQGAFMMGAIDEATLEATLAQIEQQRAEQTAALDAADDELDQAEAELAANERELDAGEKQLKQARSQLDASAAELAAGQRQIDAGARELDEGQDELDRQRETYRREKAEALAAIQDAQDEVDALEDARWYVQSRSSNASYASVESDSSSIEAIGLVFPVVFIIVAVLIGLTTITRMVEEERGLIGTYKSLGYRTSAIMGKYVLYALAACLVGGLLGELCGSVAFPAFLFTIFDMMYLLPSYPYAFDALYGIGSFLFFTVGIAGSAFLACRSELKQTPAVLMRPKAPRAGSRVFLERITPLWNRLSFLNKVTTRNLLRYKKRFFMTVFGIAGCMALLICGFAIKDSVHALAPMQYEQINRYDVLAVVQESEFDQAGQLLVEDDDVRAIQPLSVDTVTLSANDDEEALQLFVVPDDAHATDYVNLRAGDTAFELEGDGLYLTRNAAELMGVADGDAVHLKTSALDEVDVTVAHVVDNYLGNAAYLTQSAYKELIGSTPKPNGFYLTLAEDVSDQEAFVTELGKQDGFLSVQGTQQMVDEFSKSFELINTVVYLIIVLAAALAFVVLFTLSTTNISERIRELATIKVLGFRRREVNWYVNKETLLLTFIGIIAGLPLGTAFSNMLTYVLKMPSIYFAVTIEPASYLYAATLTIVFALIVALLSNKTLRRIDMIEALKSAE